MKTLAYILRLVNWLVTMGGGAIGFLWFANIIDLNRVSIYAAQANTNPSLRIILIVIAVYLVLFNLLYFVGALFTREYASHVNLDIPDGNFSITLSAIENSLRRVVKILPDVHDVHIRLYKDKKAETKPIIIRAAYSTWEGTNAREVTEKIQAVIKQRFQEIVELKESPVFHIVLANIVERDHKKSESKKKGKELPAQTKTFYGPEYPIDT